MKPTATEHAASDVKRLSREIRRRIGQVVRPASRLRWNDLITLLTGPALGSLWAQVRYRLVPGLW